MNNYKKISAAMVMLLIAGCAPSIDSNYYLKTDGLAPDGSLAKVGKHALPGHPCPTPKTPATPGPTLFGKLKLGEPLTIPVCPLSSYGFIENQQHMCYLPAKYDDAATRAKPIEMRKMLPVCTGKVNIYFTKDKQPAIVKRYERLIGKVVDNRLEEVILFTSGIRTQDRDLDMLVKKFGPPSKQEPTVLQNQMGATYHSFKALWIKPDVQVMFFPSTQDLDYGKVIIDSAHGVAMRAAKMEKDSIDPNPL